MITDQERIMFGCNMSDFMDSVVASPTYQDALQDCKGHDVAFAKVAMSLLSDAQEEVARGWQEEARKTINRAKYLLENIGE